MWAADVQQASHGPSVRLWFVRHTDVTLSASWVYSLAERPRGSRGSNSDSDKSSSEASKSFEETDKSCFCVFLLLLGVWITAINSYAHCFFITPQSLRSSSDFTSTSSSKDSFSAQTSWSLKLCFPFYCVLTFKLHLEELRLLICVFVSERCAGKSLNQLTTLVQVCAEWRHWFTESILIWLNYFEMFLKQSFPECLLSVQLFSVVTLFKSNLVVSWDCSCETSLKRLQWNV